MDDVYFIIKAEGAWTTKTAGVRMLKPGRIYLAPYRRLNIKSHSVVILSNAEVIVRTKGNLGSIIDLRED